MKKEEAVGATERSSVAPVFMKGILGNAISGLSHKQTSGKNYLIGCLLLSSTPVIHLTWGVRDTCPPSF